MSLPRTQNKSKTILFQWISAPVFIGLGALLYTPALFTEKITTSGEPRALQLQRWLFLMFVSEGIGQIFIGLCSKVSNNQYYRYFEWNVWGHIAWICFVLTFISRVVVGATVLYSPDTLTTNAIAIAVWVVAASAAGSKSIRKFTNLAFFSCLIFSIVTLSLRAHQLSPASQVLDVIQNPIYIAPLTQIVYASLLIGGVLGLPFWIGEILNIFVWIALYYGAPTFLSSF